MGMKTNLSKEDFENILSNYNLGKYKNFKVFAHGGVQTTLLLRTTKGKFVLRYYEHRSEEWVLFEIKLFQYLMRKNYPIPIIIKNSAGKFYGKYKNKPYVIIEYLKGQHGKNPNDFFDKTKVSNVVKIISCLHNLTRENVPGFFNGHEKFDAEYCLREYKKIPRKIKISEREKWLKNQLSILEFPKFLPKGLCHADLNHGNFLFKTGKIVGVLDFDMSFYSYFIYDVASLIYWWAWPPKEGFSLFKSKFILNEYIKNRKLNESEKHHVYDALKLIILLGISWSEDNEFDSEKEKIEFLNNIGRENFYQKLFY